MNVFWLSSALLSRIDLQFELFVERKPLEQPYLVYVLADSMGRAKVFFYSTVVFLLIAPQRDRPEYLAVWGLALRASGARDSRRLPAELRNIACPSF